MSRERGLYLLLILIYLIAALHIGATVFDLYWRFWWFDLPLHLLGGAFVALLFIWLCFFSGYVSLSRPSSATLLFLSLGAVLLTSIGWELFEWLVGHTWSPEGYWLDTAIDVALGLLGGILGYAVVFRLARREVA